MLQSIIASSQIDSLTKNLTISGYLETYYAYDFNQPELNQRPNFVYSHNRHNEFNMNLGFIKLNYQNNRVEANLALMSGTYARANLAQEPTIYQMIAEATISLQLFEERDIWFTSGVFPSHIGFESAIGADCMTLTRSILAENSPYFLSGAKLFATSKNKKWTAGLIATNGWQRIERQPYNSSIGIGHQLTYTHNKNFSINSSSFIGSEFPDTARRMRYFHNLYSLFRLSNRLTGVVGFDIGAEQKSAQSSNYNIWYSPVVILQYELTNKLNIAARGELYNDESEVIVTTLDGNGFSTLGYSLNIDYAITDRVMLRVEGKTFTDERNIFLTPNGTSNSNFSLASALTFKF